MNSIWVHLFCFKGHNWYNTSLMCQNILRVIIVFSRWKCYNWWAFPFIFKVFCLPSCIETGLMFNFVFNYLLFRLSFWWKSELVALSSILVFPQRGLGSNSGVKSFLVNAIFIWLLRFWFVQILAHYILWLLLLRWYWIRSLFFLQLSNLFKCLLLSWTDWWFSSFFECFLYIFGNEWMELFIFFFLVYFDAWLFFQTFIL